MSFLEAYTDKLSHWYENDFIGPVDVTNAAESLDLSRLTVWSYLKRNGKNVNTAEEIYNYFKSVVDARRERLEKDEILKDYSHT